MATWGAKEGENEEVDLEKEFRESFEAREEFARSLAAGKFKLVPRDLDREVRQNCKKVAAPSEVKLRGILDMYRGAIQDLSKEREEAEEAEASSSANISESSGASKDFLSSLTERSQHFSNTFEPTFGRWIKDRDEDGLSSSRPGSMGEGLPTVASSVLKLSSALENQAKIRSDVIAVGQIASGQISGGNG